MPSTNENCFRVVWQKEKPLLGLMLLITVMYSVFSIVNHLHFDSNAWDLGNFDQMVWHYSRFEAPACTQLGLANCLGDHFSPILALCAPLFWVYPHVEILLAAQVLLIALSLIPLFLFAERKVGRSQAYALATAYSIFWGIQSTIRSDFHPDVFALPIIAFAIYWIDREQWISASISVFLLLFVKEDLTLLVSFFGIYLAIHKKLTLGFFFFLTGLVFFYLEVVVWIPHFHGTEGQYPHWLYSELGSQPAEAVRAVLKNPFLPILVMFSNWIKMGTLLRLFGPFLFLCLYSSLALLMIPLVMAKELNSNPHMWEMATQYSATLCPILFMAAADGVARWRKKPLFKMSFSKKIPTAPVLILIINLILILFLAAWRGVEHARFWTFTDRDRTAGEVYALIPPDASVETQTSIAPHLTHRKIIYSLDDVTRCDAIDPDFVVACRDINCYPVSYQDMANCMAEKEHKGYRKIFESNGWIVLESPNYSGVSNK
jgi:uncharacterized membrane protein